MKFLADENISTNVVKTLKSRRIDIVSIREYALSLSDEVVLEKANEQNRILITFDSDFGELIFRRKLKSQGVILLDFMPKSPQHIVETTIKVITTQPEIQGYFTVVKEKRVRVLKLKK